MHGPFRSRRRFLSLAAAGIATGCVATTPLHRPNRVKSGPFVFADLEHFRKAHATATRHDAPSAFPALARYIEDATPGLQAYLKAYGVTAEGFEERLRTHPRFYRDVANIGQSLASQLDATRLAADEFHRLLDRVPPVPVFFIVGTLTHGATVKEVTQSGGEDGLGVLIPVELVAMTDATDMREFPEGRRGRRSPADLPQLIAHELTHVAQVRLQGLDEYRAIYRDRERGNHLAYAIREGAADLVAFLCSGMLREQHRYFIAHEAEVRREFAALLQRPVAETTGWFSGWDEERADRPGQLGYAVGWAICSEYYGRRADKPAALRELLSAVEPRDFERIAAPYFRADA